MDNGRSSNYSVRKRDDRCLHAGVRLFLREVARETEIRYSYVTVFVEQNICRLKNRTTAINRRQVTKRRNVLSPGACPTAHRSTFWAIFLDQSLLDNFWLKDRNIFDGSIFNADPHELQVTWRRVYNWCLVVRELFVNWEAFIKCSWRFWSKYILVGQ